MKKYRVRKNKINNDRIMTPTKFTDAIVKHFDINGIVLEPSCGTGNFITSLKKYKNVTKLYWCEIDKNKDFFDFNKKVDWVISNPPFSNVTNFLTHAFEISNNVVFILTLYHIWTRKRREEREKYGFGIKELCIMDYPDNFPKAGFELGIVHFQKGYKGNIKLSKLIE